MLLKLGILVDGMVSGFIIDKPKLKMGRTLYSGYADNLHGPSLNMIEVTTHFVDIFRKPENPLTISLVLPSTA